mgnify:FL=1
MNSNLKSLEEKVNRLLCLYQDVRTENMELRTLLSQSSSENEKLNEKIQVAANRLETLLTNIPETKK